MKRKNVTRSALFTSVLSLLLCVSMLVGTTFAWFTDTAASGLNEIIAGNLDVALLDNAGNSVEGDTELFAMPELWEPGAVAYAQIQVANQGTLDLKASLSINYEDVNSINGHVLSEVLKYAIIDASNVDLSSRAAVLKAAKESNNKGALNIYDFSIELQAGEVSALQTLVIFWEPNANDVDNLYNVNNGKTTSDGQPLQINLGVKVFATQLGGNADNESDSFGTDYDKNAPVLIRFDNVNYDTFAEALAAARADNGGTIEISGYVEFTPVAQHDGFHHGDEDFTGITVKGIDDSAVFAIVGGGVPDIVNGTFEDLIFVDEGTYNTTAAEFMYQNFANTTFTGVTFVDGVRIGSSYAGTANTQTTFSGCVFNASTNQEYALFIDNGGVKIDGCTFNATSAAYGVIKVYDSRYALQPSNVAITNTTFNNETKKQNINSAYHDDIDITIDGVPYYNVESTDQLAAALNNADAKKIINLDSSMKMASSGTSSEVTITAAPGAVLDMTWGAYLENAKLTFEKVNFKTLFGYPGGAASGSDYAALYSKNVTYNDCTFSGSMLIGRDGATFNGCTFNDIGNDYIRLYGNVATFDRCTFNSDGKAILAYSDGNGVVPAVSVTNCVFNATKEAFAGAVNGMPCAAIEIDNYGCGVNLTTSGNTIGENFSAEWRIKTYYAGREEVIINGVTYTSQAVGGTAFVVVKNDTEFANALAAGATNIYLQNGQYGNLVITKNDVVIHGSKGATVGSINLNGAENVTLKGITFDAAKAQLAYDGKGNGKQYANIFGADASKPAKGAHNIVIDGCTFTGEFAKGGAAIAFTDQSRTSGQSGNITVKNCTFATTGAYYDIYMYYSGSGSFNIEGNTFDSECQALPIYLGRYQSSTPVVVKGNTFENDATFADAAYIQAHSTAYTVSFDAADNTFNG